MPGEWIPCFRSQIHTKRCTEIFCPMLLSWFNWLVACLFKKSHYPVLTTPAKQRLRWGGSCWVHYFPLNNKKSCSCKLVEFNMQLGGPEMTKSVRSQCYRKLVRKFLCISTCAWPIEALKLQGGAKGWSQEVGPNAKGWGQGVGAVGFNTE